MKYAIVKIDNNHVRPLPQICGIYDKQKQAINGLKLMMHFVADVQHYSHEFNIELVEPTGELPHIKIALQTQDEESEEEEYVWKDLIYYQVVEYD
jgi:hypothetical protein